MPYIIAELSYQRNILVI